MNLIGQPIDRIDGLLKVTGEARYAAEFPEARLAHAVLVTSTIASGTIASSSWRRPSSTSCFSTFRARFVPVAISLENRFACPTTRLVALSSWP